MYFNKYIKYKLKYLNLKKEQEGGVTLYSVLAKLGNRAMDKLPSMPSNPFYTETREFSKKQYQFILYLQQKLNEKKGKQLSINEISYEEEKNMLDDIFARQILVNITNSYNETTLDDKIKNAIDVAFKNDKLKAAKYKEYIVNNYSKFQEHKKELIKDYKYKDIKQNIVGDCACSKIIEKDIIFKIKNKLPNFAYIDDAIIETLNNIDFEPTKGEYYEDIKNDILSRLYNDSKLDLKKYFRTPPEIPKPK